MRSADAFGRLTQPETGPGGTEEHAAARPVLQTPFVTDEATRPGTTSSTVGTSARTSARDPDPDLIPTPAEHEQTPSPSPTPVPLQYSDEEIEAIVQTLTDGEIWMASGAFGTTKTLVDGPTTFEMDIYTVGGTIDEWGKLSTQHHWRVQTPGVIQSTKIDYGDGTTWSNGPYTRSDCDDPNGPEPWYPNLPSHVYEPGTYTVTATVTTALCHEGQPVPTLSDHRTFTQSMRFAIPDGWMVHPNETARGLEGARCTRTDCGDFPDGFERPRNVT